MVSNLLQRFGQTDEILLTTNDEKRLLTETTTNILVETFDESDVVSPNSESQIYNMLRNLLFSNKTVVKEQSDKMWGTVFWNEENYRPDKAANTLNEVYKKLDVESKKKLSELYKKFQKDGRPRKCFVRYCFSEGTGDNRFCQTRIYFQGRY
jgi:pullulanase/glycogen debranching enzyme